MIALPYLSLEIFYILLSIFEQSKIKLKDKNLKIRVACCISFLVFFGFRGFIGWDFSSYYPMFVECKGFSYYFKGEVATEPGFYLYLYLIKSIWNNYHFYIFISVLIDILLINQIIKRYKFNYALCFVIYIAMMANFEIDLQRNAKSILLFLISIRYIYERRFLPYLIINLIGLSFHLSAILYIPCYLFLNKAFKQKTIIYIFIILQILYFLQINIFLSILTHIASTIGGIYGALMTKYFENDNFAFSKGFSIGHIERTITFLLIICNYYNLLRNNKINVIFINSFLLLFSFQIIFNGLSIIADRLANLFIYSYLVIWPEILRCYKTNKLKRQLWFIFICIYSLLKIEGTYSGIFFKYDNILFGIDSFDDRYKIFKSNSDEILKNNLNNSK